MNMKNGTHQAVARTRHDDNVWSPAMLSSEATQMNQLTAGWITELN
jgi:hypothetical protein